MSSVRLGFVLFVFLSGEIHAGSLLSSQYDVSSILFMNGYFRILSNSLYDFFLFVFVFKTLNSILLIRESHRAASKL